VARLASLIDELLDVSRISEGRLSLQPERLDLAELAREIAARFAEEKRAAPPIAVRAEGPVVGQWDRRRLEQVVENLVSNAVKYGAGSPVEVEVALDGSARLTVADGGAGIAARDQARIFERFERAVPSRTVAGLGLGLWIVREIVTASGGTVSVESELNRGSKFTVRLPLDQAANG
jgi:signal transduction histidine kinase